MLRNVEEKLKRRLSLLKPSLINTKSRLTVYKTIIKSKMSYAGEIIIMRNNEKYINKWESMLYRLLKMLFWIRTNINKQKLFEVLELRKPKWIIAEYLSIKTIKLKLDCLFQRKPSKPKCICNEIINCHHVVNSWPKTDEWRRVYNEKAEKQLKMKIWEAFNLKVEEYQENAQSTASLLNEATEELVSIYLETKVKDR